MNDDVNDLMMEEEKGRKESDKMEWQESNLMHILLSLTPVFGVRVCLL